MSRPFMPFYDGDWLRDTAHLDDCQERAYFRLVMFYWAAEKLPNDEGQLARICRMTPAKWKKNREVLSSFFEANWFHKRIEKELEKSRKFVEKQRENGAKPKAKREPDESQNETRAPVPQPQPLLEDKSSNDTSLRARASLDQIEADCRKAGNHENSPDPGFMILAPILGLIDQGADMETEILPAIRAKKTDRAKSWSYYVPIIQDFRSSRKAASLSVVPDARAPPPGKPDMYAAMEESKRILEARRQA